MAFSSSKDSDIAIAGPMRMVFGDYTNTVTDTGGEIATGLMAVKFAMIIPSSRSTFGADAIQLNTASQGDITITTNAGESGKWWAMGYGG